jgi:hypothetical protein
MLAEGRWSGQVADLAPLVMGTMGTHAVQLYEDDDFLTAILARVVGDGLEAGDAVVVIATERHRQALEAQLVANGVEVEAASDAERYVALDAADTLASFIVDGAPDPAASRRSSAVLDRAANATVHGRIRAFGEMVALLWADGKRDAALALEELWNVERRKRRGSRCSARTRWPCSGSPTTRRASRRCVATTATSRRPSAMRRSPRRASGCGPSRSAAEGARARGRERARTVAGLTVICTRCRTALLRAARIGTGEAERIAEHLRSKHPGVLRSARPMLGEILSEVVIDEL